MEADRRKNANTLAKKIKGTSQGAVERDRGNRGGIVYVGEEEDGVSSSGGPKEKLFSLNYRKSF